MEKCTICDKTYKNAATLKAHYNTNTHKQQAGLVPGVGTPAATKQSIPGPEPTNKPAQPTLAPIADLSSFLPPMIPQQDADDDIYEYRCVACPKAYPSFQELEKHQYECSSFAAAVFFSMNSGINLGLCLKILLSHKLHQAGEDRMTWQLKLLELARVNGAFDIDVRQKMAANPDPTPIPEIMFEPDKSYSWINYVGIRPIYEENMTALLKTEVRNKLANCGKECFKTLVDIIYEQPENQNWFMTDMTKELAVVVNVNGDIAVIEATDMVFRMINKHIYYLINLFNAMGKSIKEIYDNLGIKITSLDNNVSYSNERMPEYNRYIYEKSLSFKKQAIININSFNTLRNKILDADKRRFQFEKGSLYTYDIVNSYVQILKDTEKK